MAATATTPLPAELYDDRKWLLESPRDVWRTFQERLERFGGHSYRVTFRKQMAIALVYTSNRLEGTLPAGASERATYSILAEEWAAAADCGDRPPMSPSASLADEGETWSAEGGNRGESISKTRVQMRQHLRALLYLTSRLSERWTPDTVREAHRILMSGAVEMDEDCRWGGGGGATSADSAVGGGTAHFLVPAGEWRTTPAHAGTHAFPMLAPDGMHGSMAAILASFEDAVRSPNAAVRLIKAPADLLYEVVTLHPFTNGNGRLCRLLFAAAAMKAGLPFPAIFAASFGKSAKRRYLQALTQARTNKDACRKFLYMVALATLSTVMENFVTNVDCIEGFPSRPVVAVAAASGGAGRTSGSGDEVVARTTE